MKTYGIEQVPNPTRVRVTLAKNIVTDQVCFVPLNVLNGERRTQAFKEMKRAATVPHFKLNDGTYLSQASAITEYTMVPLKDRRCLTAPQKTTPLFME